MRKWRFIDSGVGSAAWNMAVDEALLRSFNADDIPVLRLYRWQDPALSFGRFSHPTEILDWQQLQNCSLDFTRRMTGGGILVHGGDLSYSIIVPRTYILQWGVKESYRYLCGFLITLYQALGLTAAFAQDSQLPHVQNEVCLAGKESYDIVIDEKKIGGNAQRHTHNAMLQHGTVPQSINIEYFEAVFREPSGLAEAATLIKNGLDISDEALNKALVNAFCDTFDTRLVHDMLTNKENALAERLLKEKYSTEVWNVHGKESLR